MAAAVMPTFPLIHLSISPVMCRTKWAQRFQGRVFPPHVYKPIDGMWLHLM